MKKIENYNEQFDFDNITDKHFRKMSYAPLSESEKSNLVKNIQYATKVEVKSAQQSIFSIIIDRIKYLKRYFLPVNEAFSTSQRIFRPAVIVVSFSFVCIIAYFIFLSPYGFNKVSKDDKQVLSQKEQTTQQTTTTDKESIDNTDKIPDLTAMNLSRRVLDDMQITLPTKAFSNDRSKTSSNQKVKEENIAETMDKILKTENIKYTIQTKNTFQSEWFYFNGSSSEKFRISRLLIKIKTEDNTIEFLEEFNVNEVADVDKKNLKANDFYSVLIKKIKAAYYKVNN